MRSLSRTAFLIIPLLLLIAIVALSAAQGNDADSGDRAADSAADAALASGGVGPSGHFPEMRTAEDGTRHLIPLNEIQHGGPPKDGIPSIDAPRFAGSDTWDALQYNEDDLVIGVEVNGVRRAYPFQVLVWHEIVNDTIDDTALLITYCPLCGTGIVFERYIDDEPVQFGVSGKLYNSDMLMYDRQTDSYWAQLTGTAVVGELTGSVLPLYPMKIMTWQDWKESFPDSEVLTTDTGFMRDYSRDPYLGYYESSSVMFSVSATDDRLHMKERVSGIEVDGPAFGAYPDAAVIEHGPVNDVVGDTPLLVVADPHAGHSVRIFDRNVDGQVLSFSLSEDGQSLSDEETGTVWTFAGEATAGELAGTSLSELIPVKGFWFAWFAFHQETELWLPE
jgi:hypothetical protein